MQEPFGGRGGLALAGVALCLKEQCSGWESWTLGGQGAAWGRQVGAAGKVGGLPDSHQASLGLAIRNGWAPLWGIMARQLEPPALACWLLLGTKSLKRLLNVSSQGRTIAFLQTSSVNSSFPLMTLERRFEIL